MTKEIELLSSEDYYSGYNRKEEYYEVDSRDALYDNPDIDDNTIDWSQDSFNEALDYFTSFLNSLKKAYEKRYKTTVLDLALIGRAGRWSGPTLCGTVVDFDNPVPTAWDDLSIMIDEQGYLFIRGYHHDGRDWMMFYFLTESNMRRAGVFNKYDIDGAKAFDDLDFEKIENTLNPIKVSANNGYYSI